MSKNIDIDFEKPKIYDEIFPKSPFYKETLKKINEKIDLIKIKKQKFDIIEPGSGTGNLTIKLIENEKINSIIAIDIDKNQCLAAREKITRKNPKIKVNCLCENAVTYIKKEKIDIIVMSFVYHEINDKNKLNFIKNMYNLLNKDGLIIIGDKFLLNYKNEEERSLKMKDFSNYRKKVYEKIIKGSISINGKKIPLGELFKKNEENVLLESINRTSDWKTSVSVLINNLTIAGFENILIEEIIPQNIMELNKINGENIDIEKMGYKIITAIKS